MQDSLDRLNSKAVIQAQNYRREFEEYTGQKPTDDPDKDKAIWQARTAEINEANKAAQEARDAETRGKVEDIAQNLGEQLTPEESKAIADAIKAGDTSSSVELMNQAIARINSDAQAAAAARNAAIEAEREQAADISKKVLQYERQGDAEYREKYPDRGGRGFYSEAREPLTVEGLRELKAFYDNPSRVTGMHGINHDLRIENPGASFDDLSVKDLAYLRNELASAKNRMGRQAMLDAKQYVRNISGGEESFAEERARIAAEQAAAALEAAKRFRDYTGQESTGDPAQGQGHLADPHC